MVETPRPAVLGPTAFWHYRGCLSRECSLAAHGGRDAFDGVMGGERGALLPADQMREVVAGEPDTALGLFQLGIGWRA